MVTANYAEVEPDTQRMNILGIAFQIPAKEFPVFYKQLYFALILEGNDISNHATRHKLRIKLADEDGGAISAAEGHFEMPASSPGIAPLKGMVCEFIGLTFQHPGDYRIDISVDEDELVASTILRVVRAEA